MHIHEVELTATVGDHRAGPREPFPHVAFAGRSNVGKSTLLNALLGRRLALVSKTPGKTRTLNYYRVNHRFYFVDLPGYGYAKVGRGEQRGWGERVSAYLREEGRLKLVVGLIDPRIPTSPLDVELVRYVKSVGRPLLMVATKCDQLGRGAASAALSRLARELGVAEAPLMFSAKTGAGKREILAAIEARLSA
jgi:GTP-binding protein